MASMGRETPTMRIGEASAYIGVVPNTLRAWVNRGYVKCSISPGGQRRFSLAELDRFIAEARERGEPS